MGLEFSNFLRVRRRGSRRYFAIMRAAAWMEEASWVNLKRSLEMEEGKSGRQHPLELQELVKAVSLRKKGRSTPS
ncbi:MAG: hypothetical protein QXG22_03255 [Candidatus Hadarchaeales archaeon]